MNTRNKLLESTSLSDSPVPMEKQPSFKTTQTNIVSLLESLVGDSDTFQNQALDFMHRNTISLLSNFKSNMSNMEQEFKCILGNFRNGSFGQADLELILDADHRKGMFTLELAEEIMKFLENIFSEVKNIVDQLARGEPIQNIGAVDNILEVLDQTVESVVGISRIASSIPKNVLRNMNIVQIEKSDLKDQPEKGHFAQILQQFQRGNLISNYNTKDLTLEEAVEAFQKPNLSKGDSLVSLISDNFSTPREPATPIDYSGPAPMLKSTAVRIHSFKVESAYLTRPPMFKSSLKVAAPLDENNEVIPKEITSELADIPVRKPHATMSSDVMTSVGCDVHPSYLLTRETVTVFSFNLPPSKAISAPKK